MKEFLLKTFMMTVLTVMGCMTMASCSSDDAECDSCDKDVPTGTANVEYAVYANAATIMLSDISVDYWDADGSEVTDVLTVEDFVASDISDVLCWRMEFSPRRSQTVGFAVKFTPNDNLLAIINDETAEAVTLAAGTGHSYMTVSADGISGSSAGPYEMVMSTDEKSKYIEFLNYSGTSWHMAYDTKTNTFSPIEAD